MKKFSRKNESQAAHLRRGSFKPLFPVADSMLCPIIARSPCCQCEDPGGLWGAWPLLCPEPWSSGCAKDFLLRTQQGQPPQVLPHPPRVSPASPLQTCVGLVDLEDLYPEGPPAAAAASPFLGSSNMESSLRHTGVVFNFYLFIYLNYFY